MKCLWIFALVMASSGCAHSRGEPSKYIIKRCSPVLQEILTVQDLRSLNNKWLQDKHAEGRIARDDTETWRTIENSLAGRASDLYRIAKKRRCFRGLDKMVLTSS